MTTRTSFRFRKFFLHCAFECRQKWHQWSIDLHAFWQYFFMPQHFIWAPLDEMALASAEGTVLVENQAFAPTAPHTPPPSRKKWMVAETIDANNNNNVMLVEVESFSHESETSTPSFRNVHYSIEGEDPNLRITHYPPSTRLH